MSAEPAPPVTVTYERVFNLGNYQSERIGISLQVPPESTSAETWLVARKLVEYEHERGKAAQQESPANASQRPPEPPQSTDPADVTLSFGKFMGMTIGEVLTRDVSYVRWLAEKAMNATIGNAAAAVLRAHDERQRTAAASPSEASDDIPF